MPLPTHSLSVSGGCNCRAIRFKIEIPDLADRPLHPYSDKNISGEDVHLPMIAIDHCNDCRRATGAILPLWLCSPISYVTVSLLNRSKASTPPTTNEPGDSDDETRRGPWMLAAEVFQPGPTSEDSFLSFFRSSEKSTRSFCGRCGTPVGYTHKPMPSGWLEMLDIVLGTIDRGDLDSEAMAPERSLWWDMGVPWVRNLVGGECAELPEHPLTNVAVKVPKARLTVEEVVKHPGYARSTWDLIPSQEGMFPVASKRGGPFTISWEVHGTGPIKLVFVMGLAAIKSAWQRQTLHFGHNQGDKYSCLILDNRGIGKSDKPIWPRYSTSELAQDVIEIFDHLNWTEKRQIHCLGVSMGGMISQEIAYLIPERLASLSIISSAARVENTTSFTEHLLARVQMFMPKSLEKSTQQAAASMFSPTWLAAPDDRVLPTASTPNCKYPEGGYTLFASNYDAFAAAEITKKRDAQAFTKKGFMSQAIAVGWHHKSDEQLREIGDRVGRERIMVMHGTDDRMLTFPHFKVLIAALEPKTSYVREGKGHVLMVEDSVWFHKVAQEFIERTEGLRKE